jgi:N-acetylglucosaminyldiphosphoundecaprenol N-acetyl-beta-D-mannosaminyltransferase
VQVWSILVDRLTTDEALSAIEALVASGRGGAVFTPNVDHVVLADGDPRVREAYQGASLSLADGMPLVWASRFLGQPLPERVAGSDLVWPLMRRAGERGWKVYLCGSTRPVLERAATRLSAELGVSICGLDSPWISDPSDVAQRGPVLERVRQSGAQLVVFALGAPKQELLMHYGRAELGGAVALGLGASLDFIAGAVKRAPSWMSRAGLEWLFRLGQEPGRLWKRYLVRDPAFVAIALRTALRARNRALPAQGQLARP